MSDEDWDQIIHDPCGLPIEFCECNTNIEFTPETDSFTIIEDKE